MDGRHPKLAPAWPKEVCSVRWACEPTCHRVAGRDRSGRPEDDLSERAMPCRARREIRGDPIGRGGSVRGGMAEVAQLGHRARVCCRGPCKGRRLLQDGQALARPKPVHLGHELPRQRVVPRDSCSGRSTDCCRDGNDRDERREPRPARCRESPSHESLSINAGAHGKPRAMVTFRYLLG